MHLMLSNLVVYNLSVWFKHINHGIYAENFCFKQDVEILNATPCIFTGEVILPVL